MRRPLCPAAFRGDGTTDVFDRLSIRTKLIAMVAAPLVVIVVLAGVGFSERRSEAATTREDVRGLEALESSLALQNALQIETLFSVGYLASDGVLHANDLDAAQAQTDEAKAGLDAGLDALGEDLAVRSGRSAIRQLATLDSSIRVEVEEQRLDWPYAQSLYEGLQGSLIPVNDRLAEEIDDGAVGAGARSVVALGNYSATTARIGSVLQGAAADGGFTVTDDIDGRRTFLQAVEQGDEELAVVSAQVGPDVRTRLRNQMAGGDVSFFADQLDVVSGLRSGTALSIDAARWSNATEATLDQLREITSAEVDSVLAAANERVSQSDAAARLFFASALVAILLAVGLAIYVAASIARPLLSLTRAADHVATEQLPRMVEALRNPAEESVEHLRPELTSLDVGGGKELAALTASVSSIQAVAVDVATEQAALLRKGIGDMFVNLARRNQALLDRQLEFIDELEAAEEDPEALESLFTLDHMATRMRRNAESLLVLAGTEPTRRRGRPVPLTKVTLAAVGEIEHFARVDLLEIDDCEVTSKAAADIAHLLSELMENATQFSPPDTRVEVVGHRLKASGYTISITDQGIGMSPAQLAEANEMLAHPPLLGLTLARTLGFIVVGRLAARHGISLRLVASPSGGVTAIVSLPSTVLVGDAGPGPATLDLTGPARSTDDGVLGGLVAPAAAPAPLPTTPVGGPPNPSSILPAFEFSSMDHDEDDFVPAPVEAPATLEEAVPSGSSFDEGLTRVSEPTSADAAMPVHAEVTHLFGPSEALPPGVPAPPTGAPALDGAPEPLLPSPLTSRARPEPAARPASPDAATPRAPTPPPPRLFGTDHGPGPEALASGGARLFRTSTPQARPGIVPPAEPVPAPADSPAETATDPATDPAPEPAKQVTAAGLVKRVPRAAGASRAMPGSDGGERIGATTSSRSPDEVRSMLSRFHSGRQAGSAPAPADPPTGSSDPTTSHPEDP